MRKQCLIMAAVLFVVSFIYLVVIDRCVLMDYKLHWDVLQFYDLFLLISPAIILWTIAINLLFFCDPVNTR